MADEIIEEWRVIEQAPDYAVSSLGRVRRITNARTWASDRIMTLGVHPDGYMQVSMVIGGKPTKQKVHRLVCRAFNGPPPEGKLGVAHWDGDPTNNIPSNLRWADQKDNMADKIRHGRNRRPDLTGDNNRMRTPEKMAMVIAVRDDLASGMRQKDIAEKHGIGFRTVSQIKTGTRWANHLPGQSPS
jgi:hypothetical protein